MRKAIEIIQHNRATITPITAKVKFSMSDKGKEGWEFTLLYLIKKYIYIEELTKKGNSTRLEVRSYHGNIQKEMI